MKKVYFKDLDDKLKTLYNGLDYKSKRYPIELSDNNSIYFKGNRCCKYIFTLLNDWQIDDLWLEFYKEAWPLEEIMNFYRFSGYSLKGFIDIFEEMYSRILNE